MIASVGIVGVVFLGMLIFVPTKPTVPTDLVGTGVKPRYFLSLFDHESRFARPVERSEAKTPRPKNAFGYAEHEGSGKHLIKMLC